MCFFQAIGNGTFEMPAPKNPADWEMVSDTSNIVTNLKKILCNIVSDKTGLLASIINDAALASIEQTRDIEKTKKRKEQRIAKNNKMLKRAGIDQITGI